MGSKTRLLIAGALIVATGAWLLVGSGGDTTRYFLTVEELLAMGRAAVGRDVTVSGAVLGTSISYDPSVPRLTFTIVHVPGDPREIARAGGPAAVLRAAMTDPQAPRLEVVYENTKPDLLRGEAQAIVRGRLGEDGRFYADEVLLKCPARYMEAP
ncbi:MAG: cytochrome c maturation protein CcmE [Anaerolineae bacterium]|nr:cytochrome c maturation protein CcmE [Anaerolineae bacterium]